MSLPKAVEEANRRAEELHRQVYGNTDQPAPEQEAPTATEQPAQELPEEAPKVEAPPTPEEDAGFKQKYEVLRGKYEAEIPRMAAEIRSLKEKLTQAESREAAPAPAPSKLRPEDREEYGELIDVMQRAAAEVVPQDVGEIKQTVEQLKSEQIKLARERFFTDLNRVAPHWEKLNEDKGFLTWLAGIDPLSGQNRQDLFDQASASLDSWRVANFFNSYSGENSSERPSSTDQLAQHVEPPTTRVSAPPPGKKIWTIPEINRFYADIRSGTISAEDAARVEQDLFAAQTEGRIR